MLIRQNPKNLLTDVILILDNIFSLLPNELLLNIISQVPQSDLPALRRVNHRFNSLCNDYLFKNNQPANIRWRLRFFNGLRESLLDDIEIEEEMAETRSCLGNASLLGTGTVLTLIGAYKSGDFLYDPDTSNSELTLFTIFMLASIGLLVWGAIRAFQSYQDSQHINDIYDQVSELDRDIENNHGKLRPI
jgi:hypothetical protein